MTMNAASAIPGLVRRIVLDGDWKDAPLILADALEEIGECRAARLLRIRRNRAAIWIAALDRYAAHRVAQGDSADDVREIAEYQDSRRDRAILVFRLYVARRFAPELVAELRILPDPAGVQPST